MNEYIIGQEDAKRKLAVAFRNRERRLALDEEIQKKIQPSNVLLIGTTGVGKTELVRTLAMFEDIPFVKAEATHFTEVGYQGRDVDSMIKDLYKVSKKKTEETYRAKFNDEATKYADEMVQKTYVTDTSQWEGLTVAAKRKIQACKNYEIWKERKLEELYEDVDIVTEACLAAENGVVFIDEIDKLIG